MDCNENELDRLLEDGSASALESLDAAVDVEERLRDLYRQAGLDPALIRPWGTSVQRLSVRTIMVRL
jgi:hypothetical protein